MEEAYAKTLDKVVLKAVTELYAALGCELVETEGEVRATDSFASTIGFTALPARGSLVIVASPGILGRSFPAPNMPKTPKNLGDWVGETSNQLLGRIKNQLVGFGVEIQLSIPVVVMGRELSCFGLDGAVERRLAFTSEGDTLEVRFYVAGADGWELDEARWVDGSGLAEGDIELF